MLNRSRLASPGLSARGVVVRSMWILDRVRDVRGQLHPAAGANARRAGADIGVHRANIDGVLRRKRSNKQQGKQTDGYAHVFMIPPAGVRSKGINAARQGSGGPLELYPDAELQLARVGRVARDLSELLRIHI